MNLIIRKEVKFSALVCKNIFEVIGGDGKTYRMMRVYGGAPHFNSLDLTGYYLCNIDINDTVVHLTNVEVL